MSVSPTQAGAELAAIDDVVRRVKQSRMYRISGEIAILWGVVDVVRFLVTSLSPPEARGWSWLIVDAAGVALTVARLLRTSRAPSLAVGRLLAAVLLFYGFGMVWSLGIGHFDGRQATAFWHMLFLFGYCLAGLWFGYGFLVLGLGVSAAIFAVYLFAGVWFFPAIAVVSGLGYVLCGLWMLRR
jgi:hypothetical protein